MSAFDDYHGTLFRAYRRRLRDHIARSQSQSANASAGRAHDDQAGNGIRGERLVSAEPAGTDSYERWGHNIGHFVARGLEREGFDVGRT